MPDIENQNANSGAAVGNQPNEQTIIINNQEVPISQAEQALKEMEREMKSGLNRNHQAKLAEAQQQIEQMQSAQAEDIAYYRTHPQEEWGEEFYEPKIYGGRGVVKESTAQQNTQSTVNNGNKPVFTESSKIPALERQLKELQEQLSGIAQNSQESERAAAARTFKELKAKYRNADSDLVATAMERDYFQTGKHPTASTIEAYFKKSDAHARRNMTTSTRTTEPPEGGVAKTSLPPVRDSSATAQKGKVFDLESEDLIKHVASQL